MGQGKPTMTKPTLKRSAEDTTPRTDKQKKQKTSTSTYTLRDNPHTTTTASSPKITPTEKVPGKTKQNAHEPTAKKKPKDKKPTEAKEKKAKSVVQKHVSACRVKDHIREFLRTVLEPKEGATLPCAHIDQLWCLLVQRSDLHNDMQAKRASVHARAPAFPSVCESKRTSFKEQRYATMFTETTIPTRQVLLGFRLKPPTEWALGWKTNAYSKTHLIHLCFNGDEKRLDAWLKDAQELDLFYTPVESQSCYSNSSSSSESNSGSMSNISSNGDEDSSYSLDNDASADCGSVSTSSSQYGSDADEDISVCSDNNRLWTDKMELDDKRHVSLTAQLDTILYFVQEQHRRQKSLSRQQMSPEAKAQPQSTTASENEIVHPDDIADNEVVIDEMEVEVNTLVAEPKDGKAYRKERDRQTRIETQKAKIRIAQKRTRSKIRKKKTKRELAKDVQMFEQMEKQQAAQQWDASDEEDKGEEEPSDGEKV